MLKGTLLRRENRELLTGLNLCVETYRLHMFLYELISDLFAVFVQCTWLKFLEVSAKAHLYI